MSKSEVPELIMTIFLFEALRTKYICVTVKIFTLW